MAERLAPNDWLKKWVHAEVDAGADIVVMHGAPLLHGVEMYRGRPIFYDLGNFIYNLPPTLTYIHEPINFESAVAHLEYQNKTLQSISIRPIVLNVIGEGQPDDPRSARHQCIPSSPADCQRLCGDGRASWLHPRAPGGPVEAVRPPRMTIDRETASVIVKR